jgi:hypothetical protein
MFQAQARGDESLAQIVAGAKNPGFASRCCRTQGGTSSVARANFRAICFGRGDCEGMFFSVQLSDLDHR